MADLTITQVREHVETGLVDAALQRLLDDAKSEVEMRFGDDTERTIFREPGVNVIRLRIPRPALTLTSVTEHNQFGEFQMSMETLVLDPLDYYLWPGGQILQRLWTGPNPRYGRWANRVEIKYTPQPEELMRHRLTIELIRLAVQHSGLEEESVGDHMEKRYRNNTYLAMREQVLQSGANRRGLRFA